MVPSVLARSMHALWSLHRHPPTQLLVCHAQSLQGPVPPLQCPLGCLHLHIMQLPHLSSRKAAVNCAGTLEAQVLGSDSACLSIVVCSSWCGAC